MFVVIRKRILVIVLVCILAIGALAGVSVAVFGRAADAFGKNKLLPIYYVQREDKKAALTFDAAWGAEKTLQILDILDAHGVKATFFLVGFWVDKYPDVVREIDARGHLIGNHSNNHLHANTLSAGEIRQEIETVNKKLADITGKPVGFYRPPFGEYNNRLIEVTDALGMKCIQWDVDSLDWKNRTAAEIADRVVPMAKGGSIVLFHNNAEHIVTALPLVILGLKNKNILPVRLDELVHEDNYFIANDGAQTQNKQN